MRTYHPFSAVLLTGATLVLTALSGCVGFYSVADSNAAPADTVGGVPPPWASGSESGFGSGSMSSGAGGDNLPPPPPSSYAAYCGASKDCTPGTSDCTPGGDPTTSAGSGGSLVACQLTAPGGEVTAGCNAVGSVPAGGPCKNVSFCEAGLGCANTMDFGVCRQYCCDDVEACKSGTYCELQPMTEAPTVTIPVCAPVKNCKLLDNSGCADNEACTVVRKDGTTSCVKPGAGKRNEPCPCAAGYVCAPATNTCMKLCHIGKNDIDCEGGVCQGGVMRYPDDVGVCVFSSIR